MKDKWTERLSAYRDGELDSVDRAELESHLEECEECRAALKQLNGVVGWAQSYEGREPERDVWPAIAGEIRKSPRAMVNLAGERDQRGRPRWFSVPMLLAASIGLLLVGSGSWWLARFTAPDDRIAVVIDLSAPAEGFSVASAIHAAQTYGPAIADLERLLLSEQGTLDTATVRVLREKLALIDGAMAEAQKALARDPNSEYLVDHYTGMMKKKLSVMRNYARRVESST